MNKRLAKIRAQRHKLLEEIEMQRSEISIHVQQIEQPLALLDTAISAARFLYRHPAWVAGSISTLLFLRHKGYWGFAQVGGQLLFRYRLPIILMIRKIFSRARTPPGKLSHD
ncbi:MAG: YqjK family protein [Gallionellaceae bacterium]|jgi:hypothetical protein